MSNQMHANYGAAPASADAGQGLLNNGEPEYPPCECVCNCECLCGLFCGPCQVMNNWKQLEIVE